MRIKIEQKYLTYSAVMAVLFVTLNTILTFFVIKHFNIALSNYSIKEMFFATWGYAWDGAHYLDIAVNGYKFPLFAFFPIYPMFIKIVDFFLPLSLAYRINIVLLPILIYLLFLYAKDVNKTYKESILFVSLYLL